MQVDRSCHGGRCFDFYYCTIAASREQVGDLGIGYWILDISDWVLGIVCTSHSHNERVSGLIEIAYMVK